MSRQHPIKYAGIHRKVHMPCNDNLTHISWDQRPQWAVISSSCLCPYLTEMITWQHYGRLLASRKNLQMWRVASREHYHNAHMWRRHIRWSFSTRTYQKFTCGETSLLFSVTWTIATLVYKGKKDWSSNNRRIHLSWGNVHSSLGCTLISHIATTATEY